MRIIVIKTGTSTNTNSLDKTESWVKKIKMGKNKKNLYISNDEGMFIFLKIYFSFHSFIQAMRGKATTINKHERMAYTNIESCNKIQQL